MYSSKDLDSSTNGRNLNYSSQINLSRKNTETFDSQLIESRIFRNRGKAPKLNSKSSQRNSMTRRKLRRNHKQRKFILDAQKVNSEIQVQTSEQILRQAYTGLQDRHLEHFFLNEQKKKDMQRSGMISKNGRINTIEVPQILYKAPYQTDE